MIESTLLQPVHWDIWLSSFPLLSAFLFLHSLSSQLFLFYYSYSSLAISCLLLTDTALFVIISLPGCVFGLSLCVVKLSVLNCSWLISTWVGTFGRYIVDTHTHRCMHAHNIFFVLSLCLLSLPSLGFVSPDVEAQWYIAGGVNDVRAQCSLLGAICCVLAPVCHHMNMTNIFIAHVSM